MAALAAGAIFLFSQKGNQTQTPAVVATPTTQVIITNKETVDRTELQIKQLEETGTTSTLGKTNSNIKVPSYSEGGTNAVQQYVNNAVMDKVATMASQTG